MVLENFQSNSEQDKERIFLCVLKVRLSPLLSTMQRNNGLLSIIRQTVESTSMDRGVSPMRYGMIYAMIIGMFISVVCLVSL